MRPCSILVVLACLVMPSAVFFPSQCRAADTADTQAEIEHLKAFIGDSGCIFIRNGSEHESEEALKHINRKHDATSRWIKTTEDFIRLTATKSSMSGKPYMVRCGDREVPCADWLYEELARYREGR